MVNSQAAVMVMDHIPDEDEVADLAAMHLEDFPADEAYARCQLTDTAPDFLCVAERDQINAYMRDGMACILVIYMSEGAGDEYDEIDEE